MYKLDHSAGQVIAADTKASVAAIDEAVLSYSRLCASIVEVSASANLPVSTAQKALAKAADGLSSVVAGRASISDATRELLKIQQGSSLDAVSFGCPLGLPPKTGEAIAEPARMRSDECS